jgi:hypothetical protein
MKNNRQYYTYIYYDPSRNNEPIYVGKGFNNRAWDHLNSKIKKNHPFINRLRYMEKNNIKPIIGIINCENEVYAVSSEIWFIYKFGRKDLGKGTLLNLTDGGDGMSGNIRSTETRAKISKANVGKDRTHTVISKTKISKSCTGRKETAESKEKKSLANRGTKNNNAKLTDTDVIDIYYSDVETDILSVKYNISKPHIWAIKNKIYWKSITKDF